MGGIVTLPSEHTVIKHASYPDEETSEVSASDLIMGLIAAITSKASLVGK